MNEGHSWLFNFIIAAYMMCAVYELSAGSVCSGIVSLLSKNMALQCMTDFLCSCKSLTEKEGNIYVKKFVHRYNRHDGPKE